MSEHTSSRKAYYLIYAALILFTATTTGMAYVDLGAFNVYLALTIAIVKATLVVLFFMHVKDTAGITRVYVAAGFFWLAILILLTVTDYMTRSSPPL
jgi:cytochrome c oxidase subunit IV